MSVADTWVRPRVYAGFRGTRQRRSRWCLSGAFLKGFLGHFRYFLRPRQKDSRMGHLVDNIRVVGGWKRGMEACPSKRTGGSDLDFWRRGLMRRFPAIRWQDRARLDLLFEDYQSVAVALARARAQALRTGKSGADLGSRPSI